MPATTPQDDLRLELDVLAKRAGVTIPAERYDAIMAGYIDQKRLIALLRQPRPAAAEPSNVYSLVTTRQE